MTKLNCAGASCIQNQVAGPKLFNRLWAAWSSNECASNKALVDQHQIALLDLVGAPVDRLDAGEQHARTDLALAQSRRIDAGRCVGPQPDHLGMVLRDQLAHMSDDQDALIGPALSTPSTKEARTTLLPLAVGMITKGCPDLSAK